MIPYLHALATASEMEVQDDISRVGSDANLDRVGRLDKGNGRY